MWKSVLSYTLSHTNYGVTNTNNLYNFIISIMDMTPDEQKPALIDSLIIHLGRSFFKSFKIYVLDKTPDSPHIRFMRMT